MALKSTIYKIALQLSDFNRDVYETYSLNVALHPSETLERMLLRLLAFSFYSSDELSFTKGLSTDDEPDIWQKSLSDEIELWIDLGLPDLKRIRKAAGRSQKVALFAYGGQKVTPWFDGLVRDLQKLKNISIYAVNMDQIAELVPHVNRTSEIAVMIQDDTVSMTLGDCYTEIQIETLIDKD